MEGVLITIDRRVLLQIKMVQKTKSVELCENKEGKGKDGPWCRCGYGGCKYANGKGHNWAFHGKTGERRSFEEMDREAIARVSRISAKIAYIS